MSRELIEMARQNMRDVMQPVVAQMANERTPTEQQQIDEYMQVRGDPYKTAALVVGKMKAFKAQTGRPLAKDPLTAAREYEAAMERLIQQRS